MPNLKEPICHSLSHGKPFRLPPSYLQNDIQIGASDAEVPTRFGIGWFGGWFSDDGIVPKVDHGKIYRNLEEIMILYRYRCICKAYFLTWNLEAFRYGVPAG